MASRTRIPKAELTGVNGTVVKRAARKMVGDALVELTAYIALANFMARGNTALGIESQEFSAACGLRPLAVASAA